MANSATYVWDVYCSTKELIKLIASILDQVSYIYCFDARTIRLYFSILNMDIYSILLSNIY